MILLDYWSWKPEDTREFWTTMGGVEVLQELIWKRIENLTVHAVDPLEIPDDTHTVSEWGIDFHFHTTMRSLPENLDIVCALHPNPRAGVYFPHSSLNTRERHYNRYTPLLIDILCDRLSFWGFFISQFDNQWRPYHWIVGIENYIDSLRDSVQNGIFWVDALLQDIIIWDRNTRFPSNLYTFEALSVLRKEAKNLQNSLPPL